MKSLAIYAAFAFIAIVFGPTPVQAKTPCVPPEDFRLFLDSFSRNVEFQWSRVKFPYTYLWLDSTQGESKEVRERISKNKVRPEHVFFPVERDRAKNGLVYDASAEKNGMKVHLHKPDTDWSVFYFFVRESGCWYLTRIEDWSL